MKCADHAGAVFLRAMLLGSVGVAVILTSLGRAQAADAAAPTSSVSPNASVAKPAAPVRKFEINEFDVEGNTVLDEAAIDAAVEPFMGPDKTMADIDGARAALEKAYAAKGYQTVYVVLPPQTVKGGVVMLKAVETKIGAVAVNGADHTTPERIQSQLPSLAPGAVPNLKTLNTELVALNSQSGDRQVTPSMKPGKEADTIDVALDVQDKLAVHGGLELNNKYSQDTHPLRLQANLSYDDLWGMGHSLSGLYSVAPQDPANGEVYALTYSAPVPGTDIKLSLTGLRSNSNVATLGSTDVLGKGNSVTLNATWALGSEGDYFHYLQGSFAWKDFNDTVSQGGQSNAAPITYYPLSLSYVGTLRGPRDQLSFNAGLTMSFRGLGSSTADFDNARFRADGDFLYFKGGANFLHNFPYGIDLYGEVDGQIANAPLISNEQFSIGGDGSVRGYLQSQGLGDDGIRSSVELRSPSLSQWMGSYAGKHIDDLRFVGFLDAGRGWLHSPLPEQRDFYDFRSVGFGVTGQALQYLNASLFVADPLDTFTVLGTGNTISRDDSTFAGHLRLQFRAWTQF
jgi:hemolysin activation/secretion protein